LGLEAGQREGNNEKVHSVIKKLETSREMRCPVPSFGRSYRHVLRAESRI